MVPALIVMTILGCDDSVSQCHYVSTVSGTWSSVAVCDAESEKQLPKFVNANYPVVVAVCEKSGEEMARARDPAPVQQSQSLAQPAQPVEKPVPTDTTASAVDAVPTPPAGKEAQPGLPRRTLAFVTGAFPDGATLKQVVTKPVHVIGDGYSWVARKFTR